MKVAVVLEPCEEGGYTAHVPSLPGCLSEGETIEEALENIREAFELYVEPIDDHLAVDEGALVMELELAWLTEAERVGTPGGKATRGTGPFEGVPGGAGRVPSGTPEAPAPSTPVP